MSLGLSAGDGFWSPAAAKYGYSRKNFCSKPILILAPHQIPGYRDVQDVIPCVCIS